MLFAKGVFGIILLMFAGFGHAGIWADEFSVSGQIHFPASGPLVVALITEPEFQARTLKPENPFVLTILPNSAYQQHRQATFIFRRVPPGRYSAGCYQDVSHR